MSQPTKAEWDQVAKDLDSFWKPVFFLCDGFYVRYSMVRWKNKLIIDVYVNGYMKGSWYGMNDEMSEEARRFWRPSVRAKYKPKELKFWEKLHGKRECKKRGMYDKIIYPFPCWNKPAPLIRHLIKHNKDIQIIDSKTHEEAVSRMNHE